MDCYDAIVVGSGPGATFAAKGLKGKRVLVLDVGFEAPPPSLQRNIYDLRREDRDLFPELIGEQFQSLRNLVERPISLKLKAPRMSYIVKGWPELTPIVTRSFEGVLSLAKGGLANGWGAGVYRFTDQDLRGFPICAEDLRPFYDEITSQIGVSGANDDLTPYFGHDDGLLPPMRMSAFFEELYAGNERAKSAFEHERVFVGRARLAVRTDAYRYNNLEFFESRDPAIYTPSYTIDELRSSGAITYLDGRLVLRYEEQSDRVLIYARNLHDNREETHCARKLCLGAGAINTARIVLASARDFTSRLPLLDNPMACIPFFSPRRIGRALPIGDSSLGQINMVIEDGDEILQATLYGATGPLRSDILFTLPLSFHANLALVKYVAPAMGLMMLFYPGAENGGYVRLRESGELEVEFAGTRSNPPVERRLIRLLRKLGYWTNASLIARPGMGQGLHFAATLPMRAQPRRHQTDSEGRLFGTERVHIVDGACMSRLPAKNLTFTIMANALRISRRLARKL